MEPILYNCLTHNRMNELRCQECQTYLCPECVSTHKTESHKPKYIHILQYTPTHVLPKIDIFLEKISSMDNELEVEAKTLTSGLQKIASKVKEASTLYLERVKKLREVISLLTGYSKQEFQGAHLENITKGIINDKHCIEKLTKEKKDIELLRLTQRIEEEVNLAEKQEKVPSLIAGLKEAICTIEDLSLYKAMISSAKALTSKCQMYRLTHYVNDWKCDRKYFSHKMYLSEDDLTFGNSATNGYPAIIGTIPFDTGLYAYEVIPISLDCDGKEGFGIIELEEYMRIYNADNVTPTVYDNMMGFFYRGEAKKLKSIKTQDMVMNAKYYVRVNIPDLKVTITGPGLELEGELKAGVAYAPCFSCGCSNNRLKIRPLEYFEEGEEIK